MRYENVQYVPGPKKSGSAAEHCILAEVVVIVTGQAEALLKSTHDKDDFG